MQAIIWLEKPLITAAGTFDVIAADVRSIEGSVDYTAYIMHPSGDIRVRYAHILHKDDVTNDLWLVNGIQNFSDLRAQ